MLNNSHIITPTDYEILARFLLAALWGGIVGAEREYRSKSAGFRTMIMISVGACFFTLMSQFLGNVGVASGIVTGVGFLGAGVIFRGETRVSGINTAASIWVVAAVGMGIGGGHYFSSMCASVLVFIVLSIFPHVESLINNLNQTRQYIIQCPYSSSVKDSLGELFLANHLKYQLIKEIKEGNSLTLGWQVQGSLDKHKMIVTALESDDIINKFEY
jgi:putative Mg2+ transporter-C (MgtC) family protein